MSELSNEEKKKMRADRLSNLPDDLIHRILGRMNAKYAVQTCILSKRWTLLWTQIPTLNLNTDVFENSESFERFIRYLFIHYDASKLYSCRFACKTDESCGEGVIVDYAISNNVKDLSICCPIDNCDRFEMPSRVFSCQSLKSLSLDDVSIPGLPTSSTSLTELHLHQVRIDADDKLVLSCDNLENFVMNDCCLLSHTEFVISCPKLVNLVISYDVAESLDNPSGRTEIKISTPRLVSFDFSTTFDFYDQMISLDRCPALESVKIDLVMQYNLKVDLPQKRRTYTMHVINFLKELSDIKSLTLSADTIQVISKFPDLMKNLPSPFRNLKALKLIKYGRSQSIIIPPEVRDLLFGGSQISLAVLK